MQFRNQSVNTPFRLYNLKVSTYTNFNLDFIIRFVKFGN